MPEHEPAERIRNFTEVMRGYTTEMAVAEARRCLVCKGSRAKCVPDCPLGINIPKFIDEISAGRFQKAYRTITMENPLPAICGRICAQETQCQARCAAAVKGDAVSIGHLERFVGDWHAAQASAPVRAPAQADSPRVAVLSGGPDSLACAADLARLGYHVTVFEKMKETGGLLTDGIPEFRLPCAVVKAELDNLRGRGVEFRVTESADEQAPLQDLMGKYGYRAAFAGSWPLPPCNLGIPGENLQGVCNGHEYLARLNRTWARGSGPRPAALDCPERVVVAGGGDTSLDCARAALRLGAEEVTLVYRRSLQELPARHAEVERARQEGIQFLLLSTPVRLLGDAEGRLRRVECVETELAGPDESGRARPISKPGSEFQLAADLFIAAVRQGQGPAAAVPTGCPDSERIWGLRVDPVTQQTDIPGVFAGGGPTGEVSVTRAMRDGRTAALAIHRYLTNLPGPQGITRST